MLRTFVAVKIHPTASLKRLLARLNSLEGLRPADADSLHVTLKFLGDTPDEQVPEICRAVEQCVQGEAPFPVRLKGVGAFPNPDRPSVLWAGLQDTEPLLRIAARVEAALGDLGYPAEARPFTPHVTLVRFKNRPPEAVFRMLRDEAQSDFGLDRIESVIYYQSDFGKGSARIRRTGPEYVPLATVKLGKPRPSA